jgi:hypothetical protein
MATKRGSAGGSNISGGLAGLLALFMLYKCNADGDARKAAQVEGWEISKRCYAIEPLGANECGIYRPNTVRSGGLFTLDHYDSGCMARVTRCIQVAHREHPMP